MFSIIEYTYDYKDAYCDLYIQTWESAPYLEVFTKEEIVKHLDSNKGFLYLLLENSSDKLVGFVGADQFLISATSLKMKPSTPLTFQKDSILMNLELNSLTEKAVVAQCLCSFLFAVSWKEDLVNLF